MPKVDDSLDNEVRDDARASRKQKHQRTIAYIAIGTMLAITLLILSPIVSESRVNIFAAVADLFYLSMASIVGAFMGFTAYMSRK